MIHWMSDEVNRIWDESPNIGLIGTICEVHDGALKGHIVIQLEIGDDFYCQLDLGDCNGLSDSEINERFVRKFPEFVDSYEKSDECIGPLVEDLRELSDKFLATIESRRHQDAKMSKELTLYIQYCPSSCWNVDLSDYGRLFEVGKEKVEYAMYNEEPVLVTTPYEAEVAWFVARCLKFPYEFVRRKGHGEFELLSKDDFFRIFSSPLRELEMFRMDVEAWEKGVETDNPLDRFFKEDDD